MARVQWETMQQHELIREIEAGKNEAGKRIMQLAAAAGIKLKTKSDLPTFGAVVADDDLEPADEDVAAQ